MHKQDTTTLDNQSGQIAEYMRWVLENIELYRATRDWRHLDAAMRASDSLKNARARGAA